MNNDLTVKKYLGVSQQILVTSYSLGPIYKGKLAKLYCPITSYFYELAPMIQDQMTLQGFVSCARGAAVHFSLHRKENKLVENRRQPPSDREFVEISCQIVFEMVKRKRI